MAVETDESCVRDPHRGLPTSFESVDGVIRRVRFLDPMTASIISSLRKVSTYGMAGGQPGSVGRNAVERSDGTTQEFAGAAQVEMNAGDAFVIETPGGGGYGKAGGAQPNLADRRYQETATYDRNQRLLKAADEDFVDPGALWLEFDTWPVAPYCLRQPALD